MEGNERERLQLLRVAPVAEIPTSLPSSRRSLRNGLNSIRTPRPSHDGASLHPKIDEVLEKLVLLFSREGLTNEQLLELRRRLYNELRQRLISLGEATQRKRLAREALAAFPTAVIAKLTCADFVHNLQNLLDPPSLRFEFQKCADAYEQEVRDLEQDDADLDGIVHADTLSAEPDIAAPPAPYGSIETQGALLWEHKRLLTSPTKQGRRTRPLSLPAFTPDIATWTAAYISRITKDEKDAIHQARAVAVSTAFQKNIASKPSRPIRERYLSSILKSLIVNHTPGNSILDDYPVPKSFKDALSTFSGDPTSVKQIRFRPMEFVTPTKQQLLLFRPTPFMTFQTVDDASDVLFRLRPPIPPSCFNASKLAGTDADLQSACDEMCWKLQSNGNSACDKNKILRELIDEIWQLYPESSPESPMPYWNEQHLGLLAIGGELRAQAASYRANNRAKSLPSLPLASTESQSAKSSESAQRASDTVTSSTTYDSQDQESLLNAISAIQFHKFQHKPWTQTIDKRESTSPNAKATQRERLTVRSTCVPEQPPWAIEPEPCPLPYAALQRLEILWRKLEVGELDRLDFVCKYSHRDYAPWLVGVLKCLETLVDSTELAHQAAKFLLSAFPTMKPGMKGEMVGKSTSRAVQLVGALTSVTESLITLRFQYGEDCNVYGNNVASEMTKVHRDVLASIPQAFVAASVGYSSCQMHVHASKLSVRQNQLVQNEA